MQIRTAMIEPADAAQTGAEAAAAALAAALRKDAPAGPPSFVTVHHASAFAPEAVRAALAGATGPLAEAGALHGGTSCLGAMTEAGAGVGRGTALAAFAIWDPDGDYGSAVEPAGEDPRAAAARAVARALDAAGRAGESPDLVWLTASPGAEEAVLAGIGDAVGAATPVFGGSAADNAIAGEWGAFDALQAVADGVAVSVLFPSRPVQMAYHNGYAPAGPVGRATRAAGRRLFEIDGRPAAEVYAGWAGGAVAEAVARAQAGGAEAEVSILAESTLMPLGRAATRLADVPFHLLAHPAAAHGDGSLSLFADIAEGEALHLMRGSPDGLVARAGRVARLAAETGDLAPERIAGALVVYCGGCMLAVRERMDEVVGGVEAALGGAPFLGTFTFGEQGTTLDGANLHGNLMISCILFSA